MALPAQQQLRLTLNEGTHIAEIVQRGPDLRAGSRGTRCTSFRSVASKGEGNEFSSLDSDQNSSYSA